MCPCAHRSQKGKSAKKKRSQKGKRGRNEKNYLPKTLPKPLPTPIKKKLAHAPLSRSPRRLTRIRVLRLGIRALAAMDGGGGDGAEGELTAQETALYDRQIRVWGVDAQKRCAALKNSTFAIIIIALLFLLLLFPIHFIFLLCLFFFKHALVILLAKNSIFGGFMIISDL